MPLAHDDPGPAALIGRAAETGLIDALLGALPGEGGAVVFGGEPGIGKSCLLAHTRAVATRRGMTVLDAVATEGEGRLPFAGLHQLLHPVLHRAQGLPDTLRTALDIAFGIAEGAEPQVFRVALAALHLITECAGDAPVVLLVDDAHWLDTPSRDALGFLARRIRDDPVALVATYRTGAAPPLSSVDTVGLGRLDRDGAEALLGEHWPGLDERLRSRVLDDAGGNPLALVELPAVLRGRSETVVPGESVPLTRRLERSYAGRWMELPRPTRSLLLAAALNDGDSVGEAMDAAGRMVGVPASPADLSPATAFELVRTDGTRLEFTHPLVRSAVIQKASPVERRSAHAALADTLVAQPHRAVWHHAALAGGPDESIATALDEAAAPARAYGAVALAGAALERACELSEDPVRRGDRLLRAAEIAFELGRTESMLTMLDDVHELGIPALEATRLLLVQEWFDEEDDWADPARVQAFVDSAQRIREAGRPDLAIRSLHPMAVRCFCNDYPPDLRATIADAAQRLAETAHHPDVLFVLAGCGRNDRYPQVHAGLVAAARRPGVDAETLKTMATAATMVGDFATAADVLPGAAAQLRSQGRLGLLAQALTSLAWAQIQCGRIVEAAAVADEAVRLCDETAQWWWKTGAVTARALVLGVRGRLAESEALIVLSQAETPEHSASPLMWAEIALARGLTALASGDAAGAVDLLVPMFDPADRAYGPSTRWWGITELVEAAYRSGRVEEVRSWTDELAAGAARTGSPVLVAAAAFVAPLLADGSAAEAAFTAATASGVEGNQHLAGRLHLLFGEWLRERGRLAEARGHLRSAVAAFERIGTTRWRDTAREQLAAAGVLVTAAASGTDLLDAEDLRIARLVGAGMTDRDIAEELYLSVRTVSAHVARIMLVLGASTRTGLREMIEP